MLKQVTQIFKASLFKKYFSNTVWLIGEKIFRLVVSFAVGVYVIQYLGPVDYGLFSYAKSFVGIFIALSTLGLESILVRDLVKIEYKRNELLGTAFFLKIIGTLVMWIFIAGTLAIIKNDFFLTVLISIISFSVIFQAFDVIIFYFQANVKSRKIASVQMIQVLISSALKLIFVAFHFPLIWFAMMFFVDAVILSVGLILIYLRSGEEIGRWQWNTTLAKNLLRDSWPLMFAYMSYLIYTRIDQVMIKGMLDDYSVGIYAAAYKLYEMPLFIAVLTAKSVYPLMVKYYEENKEKLFNVYLQLTSWMSLLAYILIVMFLLFSNKLVLFLYGEKFLESSKVLMFLSLGLIPMFNAFLRSTYITISNNQKIILYTTVFSAGLNILLNFYFIHFFGMLGAVYATIITQLFSLFLLNIVFPPTRKIFFIQTKALLLMGIRR